MARFPFGWLRDEDGGNWQIFWSSEDSKLTLRRAGGSEVVEAGSAPTWYEAKKAADRLRKEGAAFFTRTVRRM